MHNIKHLQASQWLRSLALALVLTLPFPTGALAQTSLTVALQMAGNSVTLEGTTAPESIVTLLVSKSPSGDKAYIDQLRANTQGTYQVVFQLADGDYMAKVSSNGVQQEQAFHVDSQVSLLTSPVLSVDSTDNALGKAVDLTFIDDSVWRSVISGITVDGTGLSASQYTVTAGNLRIQAGVMTSAGSHIIAVIATGYNDLTVSQVLKEDSSKDGSSGSSSGSSKSSNTPTSPVTAPVSTNSSLPDETGQEALAVLNNVTAEQQVGAALPEDAPQLNPSALTATVLTAADGVQLSVPSGALNNQSESLKCLVKIGKITTPPQSDSAVQVLNPLKYQRHFELENAVGLMSEEEANFTAPVKLTFPIAIGDLPTGTTTGQLAIYGWNLDNQEWVKLGGIFDPLTNTFSVPIYHFATYAIMVDTSSVPERIAGADRFLTANAVAAQGWKTGADNVVLVNAVTFADALAAVPLAFKLNAPILLTERDTITPSSQEQLQKLGAKKITLVGGTGVISVAIEVELQKAYGTDNVQRYGGFDRYDTAALIATALGTTGQAVLVNGEDGRYSDALAISAYAAYHGIPILFTETQALPAATAQALIDQKVSSTLVVGGEAVVPANVFNQLQGASRYAGIDSYATGIAIAEGLNLNPNRIYIATGLNFADALTAGNLAAHTLSPLIMVDQTVPQASADYLTKQQGAISELVIIGGKGIISAEQERALRTIIL